MADKDIERVFGAMRRALFRQAAPFNEGKNAPIVTCEPCMSKSMIYVNGAIDLSEIAVYVVAELRKHDKMPQVIERTAQATAKAVIEALTPSVVADEGIT